MHSVCYLRRDIWFLQGLILQVAPDNKVDLYKYVLWPFCIKFIDE